MESVVRLTFATMQIDYVDYTLRSFFFLKYAYYVNLKFSLGPKRITGKLTKNKPQHAYPIIVNMKIYNISTQ